MFSFQFLSYISPTDLIYCSLVYYLMKSVILNRKKREKKKSPESEPQRELEKIK